LLDIEQEARVAIEDGDYVGVIFDQNDFSPKENMNSVNINSIGYVPASLKVNNFEGGNFLNKIPTGM
jgi:hypothetical protein